MSRWAAAPPFMTPKVDAEDCQGLLALAQRAANGDDGAARELLQAVAPAMHRAIVGVLGTNHAEIDDVSQESMIGFLRALGAFRGECHPAGYAARIALHTALRARRRAKLERTRTDEIARLSPEEPSLPAAEPSAERRRNALRGLLEDLPPEQAETLALRVVLGWSLEEVAIATGAPINTVRSRVRLAKEALRRRLEEDPRLVEELEVES
ncbi:MAG TPA: RNA polymerase sigma factor [Polyangiaceae bacterium]|nr:RNA polymerase sigma factor [Polyangiaceae bacterium]